MLRMYARPRDARKRIRDILFNKYKSSVSRIGVHTHVCGGEVWAHNAREKGSEVGGSGKGSGQWLGQRARARVDGESDGGCSPAGGRWGFLYMAKKWTEVGFFFLDFWGPTPYNRSMRKTRKVKIPYDAISSLTPEEAGELLASDDGNVVSTDHSGFDWSSWIHSPTATSSGAGAWSTISGGSLGSSPGTVTVKVPLECEEDIKAPNIQAMEAKIKELEKRVNDLEARRRGFFVKPRI